MITVLLLAAAALQQQPQASRRPTPPTAAQAPAPTPGLQRTAAPKSAFDSTAGTVSDVGIKVSEMRSVYDQYRLAAFNQSDGAVSERASQFGASCRTVINAIQRGSSSLCRGCMASRALQTALDQYRASLPAVQRMASQCVTRMQNVNPSAPSATQNAELRRDVRTVGTQMVEGLRVYETRLQALRVAMGWDIGPTPTPRRGT